MFAEFVADHRQWLRALVIAGSATAGAGLVVYCWRSYRAAADHQSQVTVVRRSTTTVTVSSVKTATTSTNGRRSTTRVQEARAESTTLYGVPEDTEEDEDDDDDREAGELLPADRNGAPTLLSMESYGPDPFEDATEADLTSAPLDRPRSDSIFPGKAPSMLPNLTGGSNPFTGPGRKRVLILGLDGAGKSTLLQQLSNSEDTPTAYLPTEGFRVMALATESCAYDMFEVGGSAKNRGYWSRFLDNVDLLMFVVNGCSSTERLQLAAEELGKVMGDSRMEGVPLLLVVTHQDRMQCLTPDEAVPVLCLSEYAESRHLCRAVGVSLHHGDPPEGIAKLRGWMFPVLARAVEMQDDTEDRSSTY